MGKPRSFPQLPKSPVFFNRSGEKSLIYLNVLPVLEQVTMESSVHGAFIGKLTV